MWSEVNVMEQTDLIMYQVIRIEVDVTDFKWITVRRLGPQRPAVCFNTDGGQFDKDSDT